MPIFVGNEGKRTNWEAFRDKSCGTHRLGFGKGIFDVATDFLGL